MADVGLRRNEKAVRRPADATDCFNQKPRGCCYSLEHVVAKYHQSSSSCVGECVKSNKGSFEMYDGKADVRRKHRLNLGSFPSPHSGSAYTLTLRRLHNDMSHASSCSML